MSLLLAQIGGGGGPTAYSLQGLAGSYTITGRAATVARAVKLAGTAGSYTYTGTQATVARSVKLAGTAGAYVLTGQAAAVARAVKLSGLPGSYTYTGQDATATYTPGAGSVAYTLDGLAGAYSLTGTQATVSLGRKLAANAGAYILSGNPAEALYTNNAPANDKRGGDDAVHRGWNRKAWKERKQDEDELERTIRRLWFGEPEPEQVKEIKRAVIATAAPEPVAEAVDYAAMETWLAQQEALLADLIARQLEEDDEEALLMML